MFWAKGLCQLLTSSLVSSWQRPLGECCKCEFNKSEINFLGHVINRHRISPDPRKTDTVLSMDKTCSRTDLCQSMGMVNQMGKFSAKIAEWSQPFWELLDSIQAWLWGPAQDSAFEAVKAKLAHPMTLALYDQDAQTKICNCRCICMALELSYVLQWQGEVWKPVAYASKSMIETERRYVLSDWEGCSCTGLGMWEVWRLHPWKGNSAGDRSQDSHPTAIFSTTILEQDAAIKCIWHKGNWDVRS